MNPDLPTEASLTALMLYCLVICSFVTLAAVAAHEYLRVLNKPSRWIWISAMAIMVALAVSAPVRSDSIRPGIRTFDVTETVATAIGVEHDAAMLSILTKVRKALLVPARYVQYALDRVQRFIASAPLPFHRFLVILWVSASALVAFAFLASYRRMVQRVRRLPRHRLNGVDVRLSSNIGPAVVGLLPSEIVVPDWLRSRPRREQEIVVTHEYEHVSAADQWTLAAGCAAVALMPWNPSIWYALSRLRLAVEVDCDQRVIRRGVHSGSYGALLIELSAKRSFLPVTMPAFPGSYSNLERRLIAMTSLPTRFTRTRRAFSAAVAGALLVTACESKLPTSAEVQQMDVASAERHAAPAIALDSAHVRYIVDGKTIEGVAAKAIESDSIVSVMVARNTGDGVNEVRIRTRARSPQTERVDSAKKVTRSMDRKPFDGLLMIDGKITNASELNRISPERIQSVEVIKGPTATTRYSDPRAVNGVILVTTKPKP